MEKTFAYLRASTGKQDLNSQKLEILEYARQHQLRVDEFIAITVSSRKTSKQRRIDELLSKLAEHDTLMVTELSRLGRSTSEVIALVNELVQRQIHVIVIKQNLNLRQNNDMTSKVMITVFSLFAELERDLVSLRTKEALAARKAQGVKLGKPKGTIQASKFDKDRERIEELLQLGLSVRKIAKVLGYSNHIGLNNYIKRRSIRENLGKPPASIV
jgi:DNA invertase Pin-like site-specific DNA recombinase